MPSVNDMQQWLRERGYEEFENTAVQRKHRLGVRKGDISIRATEGDDGRWSLADATLPRNRKRGSRVLVDDSYPVRSRSEFDHAMGQIEVEQARNSQLAEVVRIALDKDDPRITGHEEPCCGLVLDTWSVDLSTFGFGANDDGRWRVCGTCNNRGRFYDADGVTLCIRSIVGAKP